MMRRMTDVTVFAQNQRDEVRLLGDKAGALQAEPDMKQQTYLMQRVSVLDDQGGSVMKVQNGDTMPTLRAQTHGHPPIVMQTGHTKGNGCGFNEDDVSFTLEAVSGGGQAVMDIFRLDPESSNSMKSDNPHSGCHREDVCHTLDTTPPNPAKGQGGMAIVERKT